MEKTNMISVDDFAKEVGVFANEIIKKIKTRQIKGKRINGDWYVHRSEISKNTKPLTKLTSTQLQQLRQRAGQDAVCLAYRTDTKWFCVCGTQNIFGEKKIQPCRKCRRNRDFVLSRYSSLTKKPSPVIATGQNSPDIKIVASIFLVIVGVLSLIFLLTQTKEFLGIKYIGSLDNGVAINNSQMFGLWAIVALLILGGVIMFIFSLQTPEKRIQAVNTQTNVTHVKCPMCSELILQTAKKCKHCQHLLTEKEIKQNQLS